jgi:hypothetical protein
MEAGPYEMKQQRSVLKWAQPSYSMIYFMFVTAPNKRAKTVHSVAAAMQAGIAHTHTKQMHKHNTGNTAQAELRQVDPVLDVACEGAALMSAAVNASCSQAVFVAVTAAKRPT